MIKQIKMITFDLDDTLWDNVPTITRAEIDTRQWIEERVGKVSWGDFNDFINLRDDLIKEEGRIRKARQQAIYAKQEQNRMIRDYSIMGIASLIGFAAVGWMIWIVSHSI